MFRKQLTAAVCLMIGCVALADAPAKMETKQTAQPSHDEMMAKMMGAAKPGPQHALLEKMAGSFKAKANWRMSPDAPWQTSEGLEKSEMILGGRFLMIEFTGQMMDRPFKGVGLTGYDNVKNKFTSVWADEMSTGIMYSEGTADASGKTITLTGSFECPMTDQPKELKQVWTIIDADHHTFTMYDKDQSGKEFESLKIEYTRVP